MTKYSVKIKPAKTFNSNVIIYTGSATKSHNNIFNDNIVGAYSFHLSWSGREKTGTEITIGKTNNHNELMALIDALSQLKRNDISIIAHSSNEYVVNCIQKGWWIKWKENGWNKDGGLKNANEWKTLTDLILSFNNFSIELINENQSNETKTMIDYLNNQAIERYTKEGR